MSRPAFFVVAKRNGEEHATLYWDELPRAAIRDLVYVVRLDTLATGDELVTLPLSRLYALYRRLAQNGKLPPSYEPPKRA
jgi:hypothetical protein